MFSEQAPGKKATSNDLQDRILGGLNPRTEHQHCYDRLQDRTASTGRSIIFRPFSTPHPNSLHSTKRKNMRSPSTSPRNPDSKTMLLSSLCVLLQVLHAPLSIHGFSPGKESSTAPFKPVSSSLFATDIKMDKEAPATTNTAESAPQQQQQQQQQSIHALSSPC